MGSGDHLSGRLVSGETPFCQGPRQLYQSAAWRAVAGADMATRSNTFRNIIIILPLLSRHSRNDGDGVFAKDVIIFFETVAPSSRNGAGRRGPRAPPRRETTG